MRKLIKSPIWYLAVLLFIGVIALATAQTTAAQDRAATGIVMTGALNVRSGPGLEFGIVATAYQGHAVAVLGRSGFNTWVQVRTFAGVVGWSNSNYMQMNVPLNNLPVVGAAPVPPGATPIPPTAIGVVNTGAVNVRSGPDYTYSIVTIAYQGYTFTLLGRTADNAWVRVRMVDTTEGWVNASALNTNVPIASLPVAATPAPPATGPTAVVNTGALNVRSGPGIQFSTVTAVYNGHIVTMLGRNADSSWVKIRVFSGQEGWVNARFLNPNTPIANLPVLDGSTTTPPTATALVNTGALNVRSGPGLNFGILEVVYQGTRVTLLGRTADATWVQIRTPNGIVGWVNSNLVQPTVPITNLPVVGGTTPPVAFNAVVTTGALNVRSGPGLAYPTLATIGNGTGVTLIGRSATAVVPPWVQVRLGNGLVGWVNANYLFTNVQLSSLPVTG